VFKDKKPFFNNGSKSQEQSTNLQKPLTLTQLRHYLNSCINIAQKPKRQKNKEYLMLPKLLQKQQKKKKKRKKKRRR